jgi:hypothetical protein
MRYAIIRDGTVENTVELDEGATWSPPDGATLVPSDTAGPGWTYSEGVFTAPADPSPDLLSYASDKRWKVETGGITVGGVPIHTDDRSKLMLMGARLEAQADPLLIKSWVASDGSIYPLSAEQIIALSDAVAQHVTDCFERFAQVKTAIDADQISTTAEVDAAFSDVSAPWTP